MRYTAPLSCQVHSPPWNLGSTNPPPFLAAVGTTSLCAHRGERLLGTSEHIREPPRRLRLRTLRRATGVSRALQATGVSRALQARNPPQKSLDSPQSLEFPAGASRESCESIRANHATKGLEKVSKSPKSLERVTKMSVRDFFETFSRVFWGFRRARETPAVTRRRVRKPKAPSPELWCM